MEGEKGGRGALKAAFFYFLPLLLALCAFLAHTYKTKQRRRFAKTDSTEIDVTSRFRFRFEEKDGRGADEGSFLFPANYS